MNRIPPFRVRWIFAAVSLAVCGSASALEPASLGTGGLKFTPTIELRSAYDDNFRADTSGESSWVSAVQPNLAFDMEQGPNRYAARYSLAQEWVHNRPSEDNTTQVLDLSADLEFDVRHRLDLNAFWDKSVAITSVDEPTSRFTTTGLGAVYGFGVPGAMINADLGYRFDRKRTDNNANFEDERDLTAVSGTLYYRVGPRTQILGEIRQRDSDFRSDSARDNTTTSYLLGARWAATALTTGDVRFGRSTQDFDEAGRPDRTSSVWEVGVRWEPLTYSRFNLRTSRRLADGDEGVTDEVATTSIRSSVYNLTWTHDWNARVSTNLGLARTDNQYDTGRRDTITGFNAGVTYRWHRWLDIRFGYAFDDSDSNLDRATWDRNRFTLTVNMSL